MPRRPPVETLSDEEGLAEPNQIDPPVADERPRTVRATVPDEKLRPRVVRLAQSVCYCSRVCKSVNRPSCFLRFRDKVDAVVRLRQELSRLRKLDADQKV